MQSEGVLAKAIAAGYEIYENPNAQVFLRRIPPKIITDEERHVVEEDMRRYAIVKDYKVDIKGNAILIYTAEQDIEALANGRRFQSGEGWHSSENPVCFWNP